MYLLRSFYEYRVYRIYKINIDQYQPLNMNNDHILFKWLDKNDDDAIKQIVDTEEWLQDILTPKLTAGNALCLTVMDGKTVAGFNLVAFEKIHLPLINKTITLRKGSAWSEQITILRPYRKQGLGSLLRRHVFEELKKRGIKKLYGATLVHNTVTLKLAEKTGFKFLADIHYTKLFGVKKWIWAKCNSKKCHDGHSSVDAEEPIDSRSLPANERASHYARKS